MCFHLALTKTVPEIEMAYQAIFENREAFAPIYHGNGFLRISWPVISNDMPSRIRFFQWGLIPKWVRAPEKAEKIQLRTLNARVETVLEKPAFREAVRNRCLIPVTGFFEWMPIGKKKYPMFFRKKDETLFSLAGIWETWVSPLNKEKIWTFSILTAPGRGALEGCHWIPPRMPVILSQSHEKEWLFGHVPVEALSNLVQIDDSFVGYPVNKLLFQNPEYFMRPEVQSPEEDGQSSSWTLLMK